MPRTYQEMKLLNPNEIDTINDFRIKSEEILVTLKKLSAKLESYDKFFNYPDKGDLYSILNTRKMDLTKAIYEKETQFQQLVEAMDLGLLIRAAVEDQKIDLICKSLTLTNLWNERWRKCGSNPKERAELNQMPIVEYQPQSTIPTFDLLKGIYFYGQYLKSKDTPILAHEYLELAARLGHFAALNISTKQNMHDPNNLAKASFYAQITAHLYWTPGYLLLTAFYYEQELYKEALLNIMIAEKLFPHSAPMINNAYQGRDFTQIMNQILNELQVSNLNEAKTELARLGDLPIYFITNQLDKEATKQVKKHLKKTASAEDFGASKKCGNHNNEDRDPSPDGAIVSCF